VTVATDLYGTVYPKIGGLEGFRHVLTPSVSFSWAPEITRNNDVKNYTGAGGGGAKSRTMSFSLHQLFQAKVKKGETTRNYDLLNLGSSLSYNFEAIDRKFSDITTTAQTSLLGNIRMSASMVHTLYKPGTNSLNWRSPRLTSFSIQSSFSTGGALTDYGTLDTSTAVPASTKFPSSSSAGPPPARKGRNWNFSISDYYSQSGLGASFTKSHSFTFNFRIDLTSNWKLSYSQSYDVVRDQTVSRRFEIERNLHCWQGYFYWIPDGSNRGYYFRLNVISIPDIKFEKSESGIRGVFQ
jgi:hypothetical protein